MEQAAVDALKLANSYPVARTEARRDSVAAAIADWGPCADGARTNQGCIRVPWMRPAGIVRANRLELSSEIS